MTHNHSKKAISLEIIGGDIATSLQLLWDQAGGQCLMLQPLGSIRPSYATGSASFLHVMMFLANHAKGEYYAGQGKSLTGLKGLLLCL